MMDGWMDKYILCLMLFPGISAVAIALGERHSCAIVSGGGVKCWGLNNGVGLTSPADVAGGGGALPCTCVMLYA